MTTTISGATAASDSRSDSLRTVLGLRDLIPMQILLVVGASARSRDSSAPGTSARGRCLLANLGISTATSLAYARGPEGAWMVDSRPFVMSLNVGLFAAILAINIPGFRIGRWIAHTGTR